MRKLKTIADFFNAALAFFGAVSGAYLLYEQFFPKKYELSLGDFKNKIVEERGHYIIDAPQPIDLVVDSVWVGGKQVEMRIGVVGGTHAYYEVHVNEEKVIRLGDKAYSIVVHDLADMTVGADIGVISIKAL